MHKINPVMAARWQRRRSLPARIVDRKVHYSAESTRVAQNAVDQVLAGKARYLGSGNFGVAYEVTSDGRKRIVKMGSYETIHSRGFAAQMEQPENQAHSTILRAERLRSMRTKKQMEQSILHEAGVANELWALGFRCIPYTVYVERGLPALVREYGDIRGPFSPKLLDRFSLDLCRVLWAGWRVQDELLIAKRIYDEADAPAGSLFVADVGIWQWSGTTPDRSDLHSLFELIKMAFGFPSLAELQAYQTWKREVSENKDLDDKFRSYLSDKEQKRIDKILAARKAFGVSD